MGEIVDTLATMLPNRDFAIGFVEQVARGPTQSNFWGQSLESSFDSRAVSDESLIEVGACYRNYIVRSARHFSFDPHVDDLMIHRYGLVQGLYHPLWDGGSPSTEDGTRGYKYLIQMVVGNYL